MKKVLFATTALVAFAGAAAAEVTISGSAEMGISGGNNGRETLFHQSVDVRFKMTGETDGGLAFGATVDLEDGLDRAAGGADTVDDRGVNPDYTVFIKSDFGTLTLGDTDGAFDWALTEVGMLTAIADDHTTHAGYSGNSGLDGAYNGQVARYDYSFGDFAVALSAELDEAGVNDTIIGLGVKYSGTVGMMDLGLGLGYQGAEGVDIFGVSGKLSSNGFDVVVNYSDLDGYSGNDSHMGIGLGYTTGALGLTVNYGVYDLVGGGEDKGYGIAANYDLGGGAVIMAGYGKDDDAANVDNSTWSLGLGLSF